jgi:methionyl-tRNA synthetase
MVNKYFDGIVPKYQGIVNDVDKDLEEFTVNQIEKIEKTIEELEISTALQEIWSLISRTNKYIDETMPWAQAKEENKEKLESTIYHLIENLRKIAIILKPFMSDTSDNMLRQLGINDENLKTWESLKQYDKIDNIKVITKGEPLFMRLDAEEEINYIKNGMKK